MEISISTLTSNYIPAILEAAKQLWGGSLVVVHGDVYDLQQLSGFQAVADNELVGFIHYEIKENRCEILTLASLKEGLGVGTALLLHIETFARQKGLHSIHLITTNDNLHALGFYQRRGYHITDVFPNQVVVSRKLKPNIPEIGKNNIPIRDEIRLEKEITVTENPA